MSRPPTGNKLATKDMYWFAHGGIESSSDKCLAQRSTTPGECDEESNDSISPTWKSLPDRRGLPEEQKAVLNLKENALYSAVDGSSSSALSSLERDDRIRGFDKRMAVEERRKQLWEAEQERNDAVLKKHLEREAALEARRNAQRSNIAFAFGSSVPRNVDTLHGNQGGDAEKLNRQPLASGLLQKEETLDTYRERRSVSPFNCSGHTLLIEDNNPQSNSSQSCTYSERKNFSPSCWLVGSGALIGDDIMSRSMNSAISAPRGRRKNDLMPTVPYERTPAPRSNATPATRKRSVSMTRLDQLAQPRKHYVEANKANSTASSGGLKDNIRSPTRPLSSASEQSGGSGRVSSSVNRRVRSSPRKPRPVSIAGTVPDQKPPFEIKLSPVKRSYTPMKKLPIIEVKKASTVKTSSPKPAEKPKPTEKPKSAEKPKPTVRVSAAPKPTKQPAKQSTTKPTPPKTASPKVPSAKKAVTNKKKADILVTASSPSEENENRAEATEKPPASPPRSPTPDNVNADTEKNAKRIISEEEAKAALAEKRRLAREQAEKEAELERQRQEELRREEEERLRKEEEEQRRMEEEQLRLLEEHRLQEEEKLRKAIEEQERKEEEERAKREEELRLKAEQERKAHEEAEKQRIELEEKLRKEEEERAERKKRLEKIMSRTRGKTSGSSPSGSISGSDQLDSGENQQEGLSSGTNSLDSNEAGENTSEPTSMEDNQVKTEPLSTGTSMEANPTYEVVSESESLNSNDLMMPTSETASQDNSLLIIPDKDELAESTDATLIENAINEEVQLKEEIASVSASVICDNDSTFENKTQAENLIEQVTSVSVLTEDSNETVVNEMEVPTEIVLSESTLSESKTEDAGQDEIAIESDESFLVSEEKQLYQTVDDFAAEREPAMSVTEIPSPLESQTNFDINSFAATDISEMKTVDPSEIEVSLNEGNTEVYVESDVIANENVDEYEDGFSNQYVAENSFNSSTAVQQAGPEELECNSRYSTSSDIKLPDPIYETSDDGSVSSEKHHQDYNAFMHEESVIVDNNKENAAVSDDVFSEQEVIQNSEVLYQEMNPFAMNETVENLRSSLTDATDIPTLDKHLTAYESQFQIGMDQVGFDMTENMYAHEPFNALSDEPEQLREIGEENVIPNVSSATNINETNLCTDATFNLGEINLCTEGNETVKVEENSVHDSEGNKENIQNGNMFDIPSNPFSCSEKLSVNEYDVHDNKENIEFSSPVTDFTNEVMTVSAIVHSAEEEKNVFEAVSDNPFLDKSSFPPESEFNNFQKQEFGDYSTLQQHEFVASEQSEMMSQIIANEPSNANELSDVTLIKADDSEDCIGIISSIDHDHISNDFPKTASLNEQLKSNLQYASITDSEESSLDSNLSQVMTVEGSEKETTKGLNHIENVTSDSKSSMVVSSNLEQSENPFEVEHTYNGNSISKANGNHFCASEIISNGHRLESSEQISDQINEFHEYVLDGNGISSVDHPKTNIFENVDAIDFSKVSPDPFLAKGNSNQLSGNPFLLQDDQKQVLMTPDFFN